MFFSGQVRLHHNLFSDCPAGRGAVGRRRHPEWRGAFGPGGGRVRPAAQPTQRVPADPTTSDLSSTPPES